MRAQFYRKKGHFLPLYIRQTTNDLTGEHSCIMLTTLNTAENLDDKEDWLKEYWIDFRSQFLSLLSFEFQTFPSSLSLGILNNKAKQLAPSGKNCVNVYEL